MNYKDFYELLYKYRLITPIWKYEIELIKDELSDKNDNYLSLFMIYFSLINDGNVTISLDKSILSNKWNKRLSETKILFQEQENFDEANYDQIIDYSNKIIDELNYQEIEKLNVIGNIFEIDNNYLYLKKYNHARKSIIKSVDRLFNKPFKNELKFDLDKDVMIKLSNEQKQSIIKGLNNNLIITGGPGTGKTTSILYILIGILLNDINYTIYLAAPSGKAAGRMKESLNGGFKFLDKDFANKNIDIIDKIKGTLDNDKQQSTEEFTIHRLLSIDYNTGKFIHNKKHQFEKNSIFVIDEASMIDICLFNNLLDSIPTGARLFILGDKDQLPSVEAGAVFADLLNKVDNNHKVGLIKSQRFTENTQIYKLAYKVNNGLDLKDLDFKDPEEFKIFKVNKDICPVYYYKFDKDYKEQEKCLQEVVLKWLNSFYKNAINLDIKTIKSNEVDVPVDKSSIDLISKHIVKESLDLKIDITKDKLDELFDFITNSKILCAENEGIRGVKYINNFIKKQIYDKELLNKYKNITKKSLNNNYVGQLMMINLNNRRLNLYNGDNGLLVTFENDDNLYFVVNKETSLNLNEGYEKDKIFKISGYVFYPFREISNDEIDMSYAITIHKSQGSDYKNILVILPTTKGHPLLNRQILYTAITRTKGNTYILSSKEMLDCAKDYVLIRDTNIQ